MDTAMAPNITSTELPFNMLPRLAIVDEIDETPR
jgi:hypothetical protein